MGIKTTFLLKKQHNTLLYLSFSQNLLKWILGIFQDGASLVTHSQILSTFQDGGRVKFPTPGIVVDVKIPTHVRCTKSNSPGLPDPPILGQTNDRCIRIASHPSESRAINLTSFYNYPRHVCGHATELPHLTIQYCNIDSSQKSPFDFNTCKTFETFLIHYIHCTSFLILEVVWL